MAIDLNQLRVFVTVVELGAMTKAAKVLKMPVSRVSRTIARLEATLGATLITRTTRSLRVSEAGKRLHQSSRPIMQRFIEIEDEFHTSEGIVAGIVRVTDPEDIGSAIVAPVLAQLSNFHPALQIELICSDDPIDLVQAGIDIGLRMGKLRDSSLKARRLGGANMICVAAPEYLERAGTPKDPQELSNYSCIQLVLGTGSKGHVWDLSNGRQKVSVAIQSRLKSNHTGAAINFVLQQRGIALVPAPMVEDHLRSGSLARVLPAWSAAAIPVHLVFPTQRSLALRVKAVLEHLEDHLSKYFRL